MKYRTARIVKGRVISLEVNGDQLVDTMREIHQVLTEYNSVFGFNGQEKVIVPPGYKSLIQEFDRNPSQPITNLRIVYYLDSVAVATAFGEFKLVEGFVKKPTILM